MMNYHWDITDRLGFNIDYCPEDFIGIDLNAGYSGITECFSDSFSTGSIGNVFDILLRVRIAPFVKI